MQTEQSDRPLVFARMLPPWLRPCVVCYVIFWLDPSPQKPRAAESNNDYGQQCSLAHKVGVTYLRNIDFHLWGRGKKTKNTAPDPSKVGTPVQSVKITSKCPATGYSKCPRKIASVTYYMPMRDG